VRWRTSAPSHLNLRVSSSVFSRLALRSISVTCLCLRRSPRFASRKNLDKSTRKFKCDEALEPISLKAFAQAFKKFFQKNRYLKGPIAKCYG